jgi:DeoR/GlpR family transcriptional regulator of sugar metabolism
MNIHTRLESPPATPAPAATPARPRSRRPHRLVTARNLAKATRSKRARAYLAANWVRDGATIVNRTVALASRVFGVSQQTIHTALDDLEQKTAPTPA